MAADGAWPGRSDSIGTGDERARAAVAQLRGVLDALEDRFAAPVSPPLTPDAAEALVSALQALAGRIASFDEAAVGRHAELGQVLRSLADRLDWQAATHAEREARLLAQEARTAARLDVALAEIARLRTDAAQPAEPRIIRAILAAACVAAALSLAGAAILALAPPGPSSLVASVRVGGLPSLSLRPSLRLAPRALSVLPARAPVVAAAAPSPSSNDSYAAVNAALARGEATALPRLTGLAQAGDVEAQLRLAALYEGGDAGLSKDIAAARLWTRRAAERGERVAMHNLGLFLVNGEGGPRDAGEAAIWFRRAADRGVVDSQHNLGLLYEAGRGVQKNLSEAYRWFSIAANAGDMASREKALQLEARLKPTERAGLDREAASFQPGAGSAAEPAALVPPATTLAETQALLARQGYYVGPIDGLSTPALKAAAAAYLRDRQSEARANP